MSNPRYHNGNLRRKYRTRFKAMNAPCGICNGKYGSIHYNEPSDSRHPLSFVIDEIHPVSRYREFGYASAHEAADDWNNVQAAHYICNSNKSNRTMNELKRENERKMIKNNDFCTRNVQKQGKMAQKQINVVSKEW